MKVLNYLMVMCLAVFATACSNDDEPTLSPSEQAGLSKTYEVDAAFFVGEPDGKTTETTVELDVKNNKATLKTPALGGGPMGVKAMTIKDISVSKVSENKYVFVKDAFDLPMDGIVYKVAVSEKSVIIDGKMNFELSVKPGEMPMSFTLTFVSGK